MTVQAGIVGCGNIARSHLQGYRDNGIPVVAVSDVSSDAAYALAEECGAAVYPDFNAMYASGKINLVSVCTPPCAHEAAAVAALRQNINVLLEKPQAHTLTAAQNITRAAAESSALLMMAFRHRFLDANCKLKEILDGGVIGKPVFFENMFCGPAFDMQEKWFSHRHISGGGSLLDTGSHSIDLFRYFFGEITEQVGVTGHHFPVADVEDTGMISVKSENGVIGCLISSWAAGAGNAFIRIMGESGQAYYDYCNPDRILIRRDWNSESELIAVVPGSGFCDQIRHFVAACEKREPLQCSAQDGLKCFQVVDAIYNDDNESSN